MPVHLAEIKETDRGFGGDVGKQCRGAGGSGGFGSRHFPRGFLSRGGGGHDCGEGPPGRRIPRTPPPLVWGGVQATPCRASCNFRSPRRSDHLRVTSWVRTRFLVACWGAGSWRASDERRAEPTTKNSDMRLPCHRGFVCCHELRRPRQARQRHTGIPASSMFQHRLAGTQQASGFFTKVWFHF
jgi:hypothetical protein